MRILVLHSDVAPDAPPDEQDTLYAADAVAEAMKGQGHDVEKAAFSDNPDRFEALLERARAEVVFNMVEGIGGLGSLAPIAPRMLDEAGAVFTGADAVAMATTNDKQLTKRRLRDAGVATPDWSAPPDWRGLGDRTYIVKSALEDASLGLDDAAIVTNAQAVKRRVEDCGLRYGGRWFAEEFVDGREFNIAMLEGADGPQVMPMAEMRFENWPADRARIVGYTAKWDENSFESDQTVRHFGVEVNEPVLAAKLRAICEKCWSLFGLSGYARVDFRVTNRSEPLVLEINTNPGISPDAGLAAAALQAGMSYSQLVMRIVAAASLRQ